jgi:hypothetical protein
VLGFGIPGTKRLLHGAKQAAAGSLKHAIDGIADQMCRRRLSVGACDSDDVQQKRWVPVDGGGSIGQRDGGIIDQKERHGKMPTGNGAPVGHDSAGASRNGVRNELRTIDVSPLACDEEVSGAHFARIVSNADHPYAPIARYFGGARQLARQFGDCHSRFVRISVA